MAGRHPGGRPTKLTQKIQDEIVIALRAGNYVEIAAAGVERLYRLYNEIERMVFLDGQFANLTTGRVYCEHDEAKHWLATVPFELQTRRRETRPWQAPDLQTAHSAEAKPSGDGYLKTGAWG